jgi:hypothetical protein
MLQPPIVIDGNSELLLFRDTKSAEAYIEAVDIQNLGGRSDLTQKSVGQLVTMAIDQIGFTR